MDDTTHASLAASEEGIPDGRLVQARRGLQAWLKRTGAVVVEAAFPPHCLSCGMRLGPGGALCATCWRKVKFLGPDTCVRCAIPLDVLLGQDPVCGACLAEPPPFSAARACFRYEGVGRDLILAFKHADRLDMTPMFSAWLAQGGPEFFAGLDLILAVPLHWRRLMARRYNQSAELGRALAARLGTPFSARALVRQRMTPSQGAMKSAAARRRNVAGAFTVPDRAVVRGVRVLLVDDVMTTGATAGAAARALLAAGATEVRFSCLARVSRDATNPL